MKKVLLIAALLSLLFPSVLSALHQKETAKTQKAEVIADMAEIFLEASQHSIVIDTIPRGTTVTLFQSGKKNSKWLYISYLSKKRGSQVTGFIDSHRVEIIKETPLDEPENPEATAEQLSEAKNSDLEEKETQAQKEQALEENSEEEPEILNEGTETQKEEDPEITETVEQETAELQEAVKEEKADETEDNTREPEKKKGEAQTDEAATAEETQAIETEDLPKVLTKVSVKVPRANIRLMPTTKSSIIHQARSGVELKHVAKTGNWHRVNLAPNKEGIVLAGYIHHNIVDEIFEAIVPSESEKIPEAEPEVIKEEAEPEPVLIQEVPTLRKTSFGEYFWVGGGAGYTMPSESNFGRGINFGGTFGFCVIKHLAIELRVPYFQSDVAGTANGLSSGRLSSLSLMLSIQGRFPIKNRFFPYLVAGGDYHLNTFSLNEEIANFWNNLGFNIQESVDHTFGLHFGAGLDVFLLENIALNMDVRYYTAKLTGKRTLANLISQETTSGTIDNMKLNSLQAGISVKLFLNPLRRKK
jgi:outer membrane protein W/SH3-like domain-containing protein